MREYILDFAENHNCIIGVCDALPLDSERKRLEAVNTPFAGKDTEKRINPRLSLPGAKSVIVLAKPYEPSPYINLSGLGCGTDYHISIKEILKELLENFHCNGIIMADDGPLTERPFAVKAGIAFWGKSAMAISPIFGTYFNLGLLVVDIDISPTDKISPAQCPSGCFSCINKCPGKALEPYRLNPFSCISYITQKKGELSKEESAIIGNQLYGCDICQLCCPFNKPILKNLQKKFLNPEDILKMDERQFKDRFGKTAMAWRGLNHLKRNAEATIKERCDGDVEHKRT